jgi:omega-amidase
MKISLVQYDIIWENRTENLKNLETLLSPLSGKTDIVILPEMFTTGFSMDPARLCEQPGGETFLWMTRMAGKGNFGICGSYIIREENLFFNRFVFVSPEKEVHIYDKRHLFSMSDEDKHFSPGKSRLVFTFRGFRISPYICYDLRFPVWSRNRNDFDLMIYCANWPESRSGVWKTLLMARAIENQSYVAGANRIGTDGNGTVYTGDTVIIDPRGNIIAAAENNTECSVTADLSINELSAFRKRFPVLADADDFTIRQ